MSATDVSAAGPASYCARGVRRGCCARQVDAILGAARTCVAAAAVLGFPNAAGKDLTEIEEEVLASLTAWIAEQGAEVVPASPTHSHRRRCV
jgi:hypothetical protein